MDTDATTLCTKRPHDQPSANSTSPAKKATMSEASSALDVSQLRRTVRLLSSIASEQAFPTWPFIGGQAVGHGYLYHWTNGPSSGQELASSAARLQEQLDTLTTQDLPITVESVPWPEAVAHLEKHGQRHAVELLHSRVTDSVSLVRVGDSHVRLAHGQYLPRTGLVAGQAHVHAVPFESGSEGQTNKHFGDANPQPKYRQSAGGVVVSYGAAEAYRAQPAIIGAMREHRRWGCYNGVSSIGQLNALAEVGRGRKDFILQAEFRQDHQVARIVEEVTGRGCGAVRLIAIAGPSSSGKTTFSHKLRMHLRNQGIESCVLSVDHYYLNLEDQPKYKIRQRKEDVNYDSIEAMDVPLVNQHITQLIAGDEVMTPVYSMKTNNRVPPGKPFRLADNDTAILIIEGIHALAPEYTSAIPQDKKYRIYISPLTALQLDDHNAVKSTQHRMLRRMSRDYLFRGHSASQTLRMWANVRKGEHDWIFPHQNSTDFVCNSAAEYELPVLKTLTESLLRQVTPSDPNYHVGRDVVHLLDYVASWPTDDVTPTALLREFIGNGSFDEH